MAILEHFTLVLVKPNLDVVGLFMLLWVQATVVLEVNWSYQLVYHH